MAKNITLTVDEDVLDRVRVLAATQKTTVNALVRHHLEQLASDGDRLARAKRQLRELSEKSRARLGPDYRFNREEIYAEREFPRHEHPDLRGGRKAK
ncbi:MAG: hypothetical protein Q8L54_11090 [Devosia sp.]|nr:hypothetical protein [Devosia sp.]